MGGRHTPAKLKLGCVFTLTSTDKEGRPVRDEESTSYVAGIETAEQFNCASTPKLGGAVGVCEELVESVTIEADYFERNAERRRYQAFRAQGLFVGSGVVEAGCKIVIWARLKCSGMFWTVRGATPLCAAAALAAASKTTRPTRTLRLISTYMSRTPENKTGAC